jgi:hypothetical protein
LPVEAHAYRWNPSARAAVSATDTTRSLNECVGLAESSLTYSGPRIPIAAASPCARTSGVNPGFERHRADASAPTGSSAA